MVGSSHSYEELISSCRIAFYYPVCSHKCPSQQKYHVQLHKNNETQETSDSCNSVTNVFPFPTVFDKNYNSLASSEIDPTGSIATSKFVIPTSFKYHPYHSALIHVTSSLPILMPICLDAKVSFKLIIQAKSA